MYPSVIWGDSIIRYKNPDQGSPYQRLNKRHVYWKFWACSKLFSVIFVYKNSLYFVRIFQKCFKKFENFRPFIFNKNLFWSKIIKTSFFLFFSENFLNNRCFIENVSKNIWRSFLWASLQNFRKWHIVPTRPRATKYK